MLDGLEVMERKHVHRLLFQSHSRTVPGSELKRMKEKVERTIRARAEPSSADRMRFLWGNVELPLRTRGR
jgi:hypothetical protein